MGQRANLILVDGDGYDLYYNHWCANILTEILFFGPKHSENFIRNQSKCENDNCWLTTIWAEGGVILDLKSKNLLFWGGEDLMNDLPLRRMYLQIMEFIWKGWTINWAFEGICSLADYVGYPSCKVIQEDIQISRIQECRFLFDNDFGSIICSYIKDAKCITHQLEGDLEYFLINGCDFLNALERYSDDESLSLKSNFIDFPTDGIIINEDTKTIEFWSSNCFYDIENRVTQNWDKWSVKYLYDNYEEHISLVLNDVNIKMFSVDEQIYQLKTLLLKEHMSSSMRMNNLITKLKENDLDVKVNPSVFLDRYIELSKAEKEDIFNNAISEFMKSLNEPNFA